MVPAHSVKVSRVLTYSGSCLCFFPFRIRGFHPLLPVFPVPFYYSLKSRIAVRTPKCTHFGLGSSAFARRYLRNRCFFLFLRLLRCFSSPGSLPYVMDWRMDTWSLSMWVSPFRYLRIDGYLLLPAAFRSLSRLSSALSAKASTLCSYCLTCSVHHSVGERGFCLKSPSGLLTSFTSFGFTSSFDDASDVLYLICPSKAFLLLPCIS